MLRCLYRITIFEAELALQRKDGDQAVALLQSVPRDSVYYTRAQVRLADLMLTVKRNRSAYVACYEQLCADGCGEDADPAKAAHLLMLLGEAYTQVQKPDKVRVASLIVSRPLFNVFASDVRMMYADGTVLSIAGCGSL